jgi:hypothetical protein
VPIASLDAGAYFERSMDWGGQDYVQTLEPRLYYLRVPYRDQSDLPLFDTGELTYSWSSLLRDNRFGGADRRTDANQLALAPVRIERVRWPEAAPAWAGSRSSTSPDWPVTNLPDVSDSSGAGSAPRYGHE